MGSTPRWLVGIHKPVAVFKAPELVVSLMYSRFTPPDESLLGTAAWVTSCCAHPIALATDGHALCCGCLAEVNAHAGMLRQVWLTSEEKLAATLNYWLSSSLDVLQAQFTAQTYAAEIFAFSLRASTAAENMQAWQTHQWLFSGKSS